MCKALKDRTDIEATVTALAREAMYAGVTAEFSDNAERVEEASRRAAHLNQLVEALVDELIPDPTKDEARWQHRLEEAELGIA